MTVQRTRTTRVLAALAIALFMIAALATVAEARTRSSSWGWAKGVFQPNYDNYKLWIDDTKTDGYCVEFKRKRSDGTWTRSGFVNSDLLQSHSCGPLEYTYNTAYPIYGIRVYRGDGRYFTLCSNRSDCESMR